MLCYQTEYMFVQTHTKISTKVMLLLKTTSKLHTIKHKSYSQYGINKAVQISTHMKSAVNVTILLFNPIKNGAKK